MDPANLPESDPSAMNFGSGGGSDKKAWKDIWGCGQGIGAVDAVQSASDAIAKLSEEYQQARRALNAA